MEILELLWAIVLLVAVMKYTVLDGFDLGVGALHLCTPKDVERRMMLSAIGPVWDGNEVWLVVVVGGLWAGFPTAYAAILSTFYIPMMFLIFGLIFRAVSIEFRSKLESVVWRTFWDWAFSFSSIIFWVHSVKVEIIRSIICKLNLGRSYVSCISNMKRNFL